MEGGGEGYPRARGSTSGVMEAATMVDGRRGRRAGWGSTRGPLARPTLVRGVENLLRVWLSESSCVLDACTKYQSARIMRSWRVALRAPMI